MHRDPFGRWLLEDLASHNGIYVNDKRTSEVTPVGPGDRIAIGPFKLRLIAQPTGQMPADVTIVGTTSVIETPIEECLLEASQDGPESLSGQWMKRFMAISVQLSNVSSPEGLYPALCGSLAYQLGAAVLVLRMQTGILPSTAAPETLARHITEETEIAARQEVRLSRRVLEKVSRSSNAVMASNVRLSSGAMDLTVTDNDQPRVVLCAPISVDDDSMEVLYVDVPSIAPKDGMLDFVRTVASQAALMRKALLVAETETKRQLLDQQLERARDIQRRLLPESLETLKGADAAVHYAPALWVGGDYCDVWQLPDENIAFALGDVSGKGLPAALVMSSLHAALRASMNFCNAPAETAAYLHSHITNHFPDNIFVTLILGMFRPETAELTFVNAGHLLPLLVEPGNISELGQPKNHPLGIGQGTFEGETLKLADGQSVVFFTDGVTETFSSSGAMMGVNGLKAALACQHALSCQNIVDSVVKNATMFGKSHAQDDDLTVLALSKRQLH